ncbi:MAG: hypothetical protein ACJ77A_16270 [Actinomycetota bacterium]
MDVASTAINATVIAAVGALLAWFGKGRFDSIDRRIDRVEERLDRLRSDLTQVALAVGVRPRATNR